MPPDPRQAAAVAQEYCKASKPLERLGWGIGGFVYLSPQPGRVVKVHRVRFGLPPTAGLAANFIGLAGNVLFILFINAVAKYFDDIQTANSASTFLVYTIILGVAAIGIGFLTATAPASVGACIGLLAMLGLMAGAVIALIWFVRLIAATRVLVASVE